MIQKKFIPKWISRGSAMIVSKIRAYRQRVRVLGVVRAHQRRRVVEDLPPVGQLVARRARARAAARHARGAVAGLPRPLAAPSSRIEGTLR